MYSMVTTVNNNTTHVPQLCKAIDNLISLIMVIISLCICISKHHGVHLNIYNFLDNQKSIKLRGKKLKTNKKGIGN